MALPTVDGKCFVGVTGHRDLSEANEASLAIAVCSCFDDIESQSGASRHVLMSGFAAGADQLVAQGALERGWDLHAVLAAPLDVFLKTMGTEDAHRLQYQLLPYCASVVVVECEDMGGALPYVAVANEIIRSTAVLIALWDGLPGRGPGGTEDTLKRFLKYQSDPGAPQRQDRPLYWLHTRQSDRQEEFDRLIASDHAEIKLINDRTLRLSGPSAFLDW